MVQAYKKPSKILRADMLLFVGKSMGPYPGKKPQLLPTNLAYSTPVMWWKWLEELFGGGFVSCGGLSGGFWQS